MAPRPHGTEQDTVPHFPQHQPRRWPLLQTPSPHPSAGPWDVPSCCHPTCSVQWMVPGYHGDSCPPLAQAPHLVVLEAAVNCCDAQ